MPLLFVMIMFQLADECGFTRVPVGGLLVGVGGAEHDVFAKGGAKICRPIGNPASSTPQGTLMPQTPARLAPIVRISARYICMGSDVF